MDGRDERLLALYRQKRANEGAQPFDVLAQEIARLEAGGDPASTGCELCGDVSTTLFLHSRCHPTAPLRAEKSGNLLTLRCYLPECGRVVARLQLQDEG